EFLATGEAGDPHNKPFFFPVVSAATCTNHHLDVDQRLHMTYRFLFWKGTSVDTTWASVDTLSQHSPEGVLGRSLVSTLPDLVSTLPDQFCPKGTFITLTLNCNGSQPVASYARNRGWIDPGTTKCSSGWKSSWSCKEWSR
ncbi:hypothetical protein Taro_021669, partial [Colocasia esculenta]|nr:hypothetical protein [Colocasia esculenta]